MDRKDWQEGKVRVELVALALLLPLAVILGLALFRLPSMTLPMTVTSPLPTATVVISPEGSVTTTALTKVITLTVKTPTSSKAYTIAATRPVSVAEILQQAVHKQSLQMTSKNYGGSLGLFVESLNGLSNDEAKGLYWYLYVNNKLSPLGASNIQVKPGDSVSWVYEKMHNE